MTALGRFIFGILIVLILVGLWAAMQAVGAAFGPPEWAVR